jgi:hypothetical protein
MATIEDLIDKMFESRNDAHIEHWKTKNGEVHRALGSYYDDIIWLNENRSKIAKNIPALENIIDELTGLHMTTLYKLENLR